MTEIACTNCRHPYPEEGTPYRCLQCGGTYDYKGNFGYALAREEPELPGIWRYRHTFGLPPQAAPVYLGEGGTPLVWRETLGMQLAFKLEYLNPTGSFKDRGSAVLASFLQARGVSEAVEDSSGNAGASFAVYAQQAGVKARIFVPDYAARPKRRQIETYGAEVTRILGPRSQTSEAALRAVQQGAVYASHAYMPFGLSGYATIAYELLEQMGRVPAAVVAPVGQGNLLLAIGRGFEALQRAGMVDTLPALVGVQALACAPLWAVSQYGVAGMSWVAEGETLAEGVRIKHPLRGDALLQMVENSLGTFVAVDEPYILPGRDQLARLGFYVEPTSAIVWNALEQISGQVNGPMAVVLTGSGLKSA